MKRRINLSLHWKSYFINLIWKCKAVWNAGFSLTFLLNMYEAQIGSCATLTPQGFFSRVFPKVSLVSVSMALGQQADRRNPGLSSWVGGPWPWRDTEWVLRTDQKPSASLCSASSITVTSRREGLFVLGTKKKKHQLLFLLWWPNMWQEGAYLGLPSSKSSPSCQGRNGDRSNEVASCIASAVRMQRTGSGDSLSNLKTHLPLLIHFLQQVSIS